MLDYLLLVLVVLLGLTSGYLLWDRFKRPVRHSTADLYTDALRDLVDGRPESAFGKLRQVVTEDAGNLDAYLRLGQILREHGQPQRAAQVHKDLTVRADLSRSEKVAILRQLALDYLSLDDLPTAEAALRELISLDSRHRWAHARLLELQEQTGRWAEAYETAVELLKLESGKSRKPLAKYKYRVGLQLAKQQQSHKARLAFKEALNIDPRYVEAYLAIGDSYHADKRYEDAVTFWNKLIETVPEKGHLVLDRLERTLFELGRFGDIAEACERILRHDPRNAVARRTLAIFHEKKGDLTVALDMLESLFEDRSDNPEVILDLARLYLETGDKAKIRTLLRRIERKKDSARFSATPSADTATSVGT